jgi:hypothetical protein
MTVKVGFTNTYAISAYHHQRCEFEFHSGGVYSIQLHVITFISDLMHVGATPLQESFQIFTVASFLLKLMSIRPLMID